VAAGDAQLLAKYRAALAVKPRSQPVKLCKFCMEEIPLGALVCKFCSREVNTAEEASRLTRTHMEEVVAQHASQKKARFWKWVVVGTVMIIIIFLLSISRP
jgi:predicted amidophosphoribosyltransferase